MKKNFNLIKIVTSIPTHKLPKNLTVGSDVPDIATYPAIDGSAADSELRKGQVLWLRGIARLQTQVNRKLLFNNYFCFFINKSQLISIISFIILKKSMFLFLNWAKNYFSFIISINICQYLVL